MTDTPSGGPAAATEELKDFALGTDIDNLPDDVVEHAKLVLLDTAGSLLAASASTFDPGRILTSAARAEGGAPVASVVGYGMRTAPTQAALVNGTMGYFCDLDAHHPEAITHTPAIVVPAALAVAERVGATGQDLLESVVIGIDVACRVSLALNPDVLYEQGFHPTPISGVFGTMTAAARLLDLDREAYGSGLGLAQTQASGLLAWKEEPTESLRPFNPGIAARNGVTAATLADAGYASPVDPFGGQYNIFRAFSDGREEPDRLTEDLGERFAIMEHAFKRHSSVAFSHPGLDALLGILEQADLNAGDIDAIELRFPATGAELVDGTDLKSHSLQYLLAIATVEREIRIDHIIDDRSDDPIVSDIMGRITIIHDDTLDDVFPERYTSIVTVSTTADQFRERIDFAKGTPEKPFTAADVEAKFGRVTDEVIGNDRRRALIDAIDGIIDADNLDAFASLLREPTP